MSGEGDEPTLTERFDAAGGQRVEHGDRLVKQLHRLQVKDGERLDVRFVSTNSERVQTLSLSVDGGGLEIAGEVNADVLLREDTAPETTSVICRTGGRATLDVWNGWIGSHDANHAWIGNSGMIIEGDEEHVRLRCSDGVGEVDFTNLVVELLPG